MKFFAKRKLAVILALCSISSGKNNFASGLTKPQKAGLITVSGILGLGISALVGYEIYKYFNPYDSDDPGKKDDKNKKNELYTQDEVKDILGDNLPKGEIKDIKDLNKLMEIATGKICPSGRSRDSFGSQKICNAWLKEIFKKFQCSKDGFECGKDGNYQVYTYVDRENLKLKEIKQFMAENKIPDIFGAAEKLGKKIVPVFQIEIRKRQKIYLYFACEDRIQDYLNHLYVVCSLFTVDLEDD